jgi:hypothetical protein
VTGGPRAVYVAERCGCGHYLMQPRSCLHEPALPSTSSNACSSPPAAGWWWGTP